MLPASSPRNSAVRLPALREGGGRTGSLRFAFVVLILSFPSVALALLAGTAHEFEFGQVEPDPLGCASVCHSYLAEGSSLAQAEPAWLIELKRDKMVGTAAGMCGGCHLSGGGYSAVMSAAQSDNNVYGKDSHGMKMALSGPPPGTEPGNSGLPRIGVESGIFQCSTCHNPHDDTFRPFLRADMAVLCVRCHTRRGYVEGVEQKGMAASAGSWQPDRYGGGSNPGSHPVGADVLPGGTGEPSVTVSATFGVPFASLPRRWSPGGHLSGGSSGGVVCVSCHAVHGADPDPDDPGVAGTKVAPSPSFLSVRQATAAVAGSARPVPNGKGDWNRLCEGCHGVGNNPPAAPRGMGWSDGARNVHPGKAGSFSHPVDSYPSGYDIGVSAFPADWPSGDPAIAGQNVSPVPICESCHLPHPAAALSAGRMDAMPGAGPYLLRAATTKEFLPETLCDQCHKVPLASHHPVGRRFHSGGVPYLRAVSRGPSDTLSCGTCHAGAHAWQGPGEAGLDPDWKPAGNGRRALQAEDMYNADMSKTCMDCHYAMDGDAASMDPTMGTAQTVIGAADKEFHHYQKVDRGNGTHYIGLIHEDEPDAGWSLDPIVDVWDTSMTWKAQVSRFAAGLADGWARFGGEDRKGARVLVCESCHELEPDRNGGFRHLLLAPYEEGRNGLLEFPGDADGRDILCEACHGVVKGSHPMTGMTVTKTDAPLNPGNSWVRQELLGNATMDRKAAALSCDSCHQPHQANSASRTQCLDVPESIVLPETEQVVRVVEPETTAPGSAETSGYELLKYATPKASKKTDHAASCRQCHYN